MADETFIERKVRVRRRGSHHSHAYRWPEVMLSILLFILFVCSAIVLGAFAYIEYCQNRLELPIPWYYPFNIAVATITIAWIIILVVLYYIHLLLPIVVLIGCFILFVLWLIALVKTSVELWGPAGSVNDNCIKFVENNAFWGGQNLDTLARIQQEGICNLWKTSFALEMVATFVLLWLCVLSWMVIRNARYD